MYANERRPEWRVKYARRLFAVFCCGVLVLGMMEPPKAKAVAIVDDAFLITAAFMAACGLSWGVTNMGNRTDFTKVVSDSVGQYLDTVGGDIVEWSAAIAGAATLGVNGKLKLTKMAAEKLGAFTNWLVQKKGITAGGEVAVFQSNSYLVDADGNKWAVTTVPDMPSSSGYHEVLNYSVGTSIFDFQDDSVETVTINISDDHVWTLLYDGGGATAPWRVYDGTIRVFSAAQRDTCKASYQFATLFINADGYLTVGIVYRETGKFGYSNNSTTLKVKDGMIIDPAKVSIKARAIDVPDTSTMADDDAIALDIGAAVGTALEDVLAQIWEKVKSGTLEVTKEVVKEQEETEPEEVTDVNQLGLPALGAALQTRFPFSIPWDFVAAVKLLAAPAVTPKWTVDILKPVQARYGIFNGDTSITIDLGEYPLIGQVSRWISTLFFGVGLMMATKKLVWTT